MTSALGDRNTSSGEITDEDGELATESASSFGIKMCGTLCKLYGQHPLFCMDPKQSQLKIIRIH